MIWCNYHIRHCKKGKKSPHPVVTVDISKSKYVITNEEIECKYKYIYIYTIYISFSCRHKRAGWVLLNQISPFHYFLLFSLCFNIVRTRITYRMSQKLRHDASCQRCRWSKDLLDTFAKSEIQLTEELTKGTLDPDPITTILVQTKKQGLIARHCALRYGHVQWGMDGSN